MFLHIDIDAFFASAECAADPSLRGVPMAVGSRSNLEIFEKSRIETRLINDNSGAFVAPVFYTNRQRDFESYFVERIDGERKIRGIVTSASYEARACGVKTAMPVAQALRLCPRMVVVPSHYRLYHTLSQRLYRFMQARIPAVEQYSIDEFFADVSGWVNPSDIESFAYDLQAEIKERFALPVSIGISDAKWIAKLATEFAKPFGIYRVGDIDAFIESIPIEAFPGIGKGFRRRLRDHYISTLGEVKRNRALLYRWKKPGIQLYKRITGSDGEGVETERSLRKSIGISRTFDAIYDRDEVRRRLMVMARHIGFLVWDMGVNPTVYYMKINYEYGIKVKRNETVDRIFSELLFKERIDRFYREEALAGRGAVKLSLSVSGFTQYRFKTLSLLSLRDDFRRSMIDSAIGSLRGRFGIDIIKTANELL